MKELYDTLSHKISKSTTRLYSTSFSMGIMLLNKKIHAPIYGIYGFVRLADEIVDSFHGYDKEKMLTEFRQQTYQAIEEKISLNPILNSFQEVVNRYEINMELIDTFLDSMEMDLHQNFHDLASYQQYILGSAEVVGLMCLKVFTDGDEEQYLHLKPSAMRLGAAFQKVNFLRDIQADFDGMGRTYFPGVDFEKFSQTQKLEIEEDIRRDFEAALIGIKQLPKSARLGVYAAYRYYISLFKKIETLPAQRIMHERIRISNPRKFLLTCRCFLKLQLNLL